MARWIAFDSDSAEQLRKQLPFDSVVVQAGTALQAALADPSDSVVVLPGDDPNTAVIVRVHRNKQAEQRIRYEATGFLGLNDQPVYDDVPQPAEKKGWWKRVF